MEQQYCVNTRAQDNGDHEVHTATCRYLPSLVNRLGLGTHSSCRSAVQAARVIFRTANGCIHCSTACHTR